MSGTGAPQRKQLSTRAQRQDLASFLTALLGSVILLAIVRAVTGRGAIPRS